MSSNIGDSGIDFGEYICPVCNGRRVKFAGERGIRWICLNCQETELRHDDDCEIALTGEYPHNLTAKVRKKFVNTLYLDDDIPF